MPSKQSLPKMGLFYLSVVYVVWGSTYLAIRVAVRDDSGFEPFALGASRTLASGLILLIWAGLARQSIAPKRGDWPTLIGSALLLWIGGNGLVNWAEQRADSGYAALIVGSLPLWVAIIEAIIDRRRPQPLLIGSLLVGFCGLAVLSWPVLETGNRADVLALLALTAAPISWGTGSILLARRPVSLSPQASAGYQQLIGSAAFVIISVAIDDPYQMPNQAAWTAWGYLVLAGGVLTFTSYMCALKLLPITLVSTYAYVNPVIAVLLGWLILSEPITSWTLGGTVLILAGIAGVFRAKRLNAGAS